MTIFDLLQQIKMEVKALKATNKRISRQMEGSERLFPEQEKRIGYQGSDFKYCEIQCEVQQRQIEELQRRVSLLESRVKWVMDCWRDIEDSVVPREFYESCPGEGESDTPGATEGKSQSDSSSCTPQLKSPSTGSR